MTLVPSSYIHSINGEKYCKNMMIKCAFFINLTNNKLILLKKIILKLPKQRLFIISSPLLSNNTLVTWVSCRTHGSPFLFVLLLGNHLIILELICCDIVGPFPLLVPPIVLVYCFSRHSLLKSREIIGLLISLPDKLWFVHQHHLQCHD